MARCLRFALFLGFVASFAGHAVTYAQHWRVDRIGLFGPEHTSPEGSQFSNTHDGEVNGQIRFSEDPLAYVTGESNRWHGDAVSTDNWIYDVFRHRVVSIDDTIDQAIPRHGQVEIDRVLPSGIAYGKVALPDPPDANRIRLAWRLQGGELEFFDPSPPPHASLVGSAKTRVSDVAVINGEETVGNTFFIESQSSIAWRSSDNTDRLIGYYDDAYHGVFQGYDQGAYRDFDRYITYVENTRFEGEASKYVAGLSLRFSDSKFDSFSAWIDDGVQTRRIGYFNEHHTAPDTGRQESRIVVTTPGGAIIGTSESFSGGAVGNTVWRYDVVSGSTRRLGLFDSQHTDPTTGQQLSNIVQRGGLRLINDQEQFIGTSATYGPAGLSGQSAWVADNQHVTNIGLIGPEYSVPGAEPFNEPLDINDRGQVVGFTRRQVDDSSTASQTGDFAWFYDGLPTHRIGLFDAAHTNSSTGQQRVTISSLNEAGYVHGASSRYSGDRIIGNSAWIFDGHETIRVGLTDETHTDSSSGAQSSVIRSVNAQGQVVGMSTIYASTDGIRPLSGFRPMTPWFFDPQSGYQSLVFSVDPEFNRFSTSIQGLSDDGVVFGEYVRFTDNSISGIPRPFRWSAVDGFVDLVDIINQQYPDFTIQEAYLTDPTAALQGQFAIIARFSTTSPIPTDGHALFLVTIVPEPPLLGIVSTTWIAGIAYRRRRSRTRTVLR